MEQWKISILFVTLNAYTYTQVALHQLTVMAAPRTNEAHCSRNACPRRKVTRLPLLMKAIQYLGLQDQYRIQETRPRSLKLEETPVVTM